MSRATERRTISPQVGEHERPDDRADHGGHQGESQRCRRGQGHDAQQDVGNDRQHHGLAETP